MLYFIFLIAAVFSHQPKFAKVHHHEEVEVIYTGVTDIYHDVVEGWPKYVNLRFVWDNQKFDLNLTHTPGIHGLPIKYTLYSGSSFVDGLGIAGTLHFTDWKVGKVFSAAMHSDGMRYEFQPSRREGHKLHLKKYDTIGSSSRFMESRRRLHGTERQLLGAANGPTGAGRDKFDGCWPGMADSFRQVDIGYIVDPDFVAATLEKRKEDNVVGDTTAEKNANKVRAEVDEINEHMNVIYGAQFHIKMNLNTLYDQEGLMGANNQFTGFQLGCRVYGKGAGQLGIETYLENLQRWRQANAPQLNGEWQILTDCFPPPGTIGIAYLRAVCTNYGVGVNTFTNRGTSQTWLTVAHEVGHNIGAGHSFEQGQGQTGGIMDYGDGKKNGIFQFNRQFRFRDVCGTLSNTMAGSGTVNNCWTPAANEAGDTYQWFAKTGTNAEIFSDCRPAKANLRLRSTLYECKRSNPAIGGGAFLPVDSSLCDLTLKPIDQDTHQYNSDGCVADETSTCGNGALEPGEECEPTLLPTGAPASCCTATCQFANNAQCATLKNKVDAAFIWDNALYLFQGDQVFRYTGRPADEANANDVGIKPWNKVLDTGFPRPITTAFPGLATETNYNEDIDSALVKPGSNEAFFFSGSGYIRYNLETNTKVGQTVDLRGSNSEVFQTCAAANGIQASMAFPTTMWLMCQGLLQKMTYTPATTAVQFLPDYDFVFPNEILTHIDAAVHDDVSGESLFFSGGYTQRWKALTHDGDAAPLVGLLAGQQVQVDPANPSGVDPQDPGNTATGSTGTGSSGTGTTTGSTTGTTTGTVIGTAPPTDPVNPPGNSQCSIMCATCDPDAPNVCTSCPRLPTKPLPGGYCLADNVVAYLGFDTTETADAEYIKGGANGQRSQYANRRAAGLPAVFGEQTNDGLSFNGMQKIEMKSLAERNIVWDEADKLRIEAWFFPDEAALDSEGNLPPQRFATFRDTLGAPKITIDFYVESACQPPSPVIFNPGTGEAIPFENCECVGGEDDRFGRWHDPVCHDGFEWDTPYCYTKPECEHPNARWGIDSTTSGIAVRTGNRILLCDNVECRASEDVFGQPNRKQFKLGVTTPSSEFNCFVDTPLTAGEWNHILFEFSNTEFYTSANGRFHQRAFLTSGYDVGSNTAGAVQNVFQIGEWEIGADAGGLIGTIDHVKLSIGEASGPVAANTLGSSDSSSNGGAIAAGVIVPLLLIAIIVVLCWYYWDEIQEKFGQNDKGSNQPISIQAPIAKNLQNPQTRTTGMSFDYSRSEQNVEWYYVDNDQQVGPFTDVIFASRIGTQVQKDTLVWNGTTVEDWVAAGDVPELAPKFAAASGTGRPKRPATTARGAPPSKRKATADTLWNYVGPDGSNIGPITETKLLEMNLPGETYVWNGTTVNNWTYLQDTYLADLQF